MKRFLILVLFLAFVVPATASATTVLSDNLSASQSGTEYASTTRWVTASFATDANSYALSSVTIQMYMGSAGTALASIYTSTAAPFNVGTPGSLLHGQ